MCEQLPKVQGGICGWNQWGGQLGHEEDFYSWNGAFWCILGGKGGCIDRDMSHDVPRSHLPITALPRLGSKLWPFVCDRRTTKVDACRIGWTRFTERRGSSRCVSNSVSSTMPSSQCVVPSVPLPRCVHLTQVFSCPSWRTGNSDAHADD